MVYILYKMGENVMVILRINGAKSVSYYFVFTKTMNLRIEKWISAYTFQYSPRKYQRLYGTTISVLLKYGRNKLWQLFIFIVLEPFLTIL